MKTILEIKSAEGGEDSKLFTTDLMKAYTKMLDKLNVAYVWLTDSKIEFESSKIPFIYSESGGHRIQRIPPTETKGRVHTSTVIVAVYDKSQVDTIEFNDCEFTVQTFSGTGKGGQHRNKHQTSVRVIHNPTGITEKRESRSLEKNVDDAMLAVKARIAEDVKNKQFEKISKEKKLLFGSGMRGDKIRTYRFQDDIVTDHRTHKTLSVKDVMKGNFQKFYKQ